MKTVTPIDAWQLLLDDSTSILIDVRGESEWQEGYPDMKQMGRTPLFLTITSDLDEFAAKLQDNIKDLSTPILFLCYGGRRSSTAGLLAERLGYSTCYNIAGGFSEWTKLGLSYTKIGAK